MVLLTDNPDGEYGCFQARTYFNEAQVFEDGQEAKLRAIIDAGEFKVPIE